MDETERQRLLAQYSEIATLAGGLAHEIRNPLSTMSLNLELLVEDVQDSRNPRDRRMLKKLQKVQQEAVRLNELLNDFLQFARVGDQELVPTDLNALVRDFVDFYRPTAQEYGNEISLHLESNLPLVKLDESLIRQVLMNLAQNARQAMPDGGHLELQTSVRDGRIQLEFIDTGEGMTDATRSKIFQVFYSTKSDGSGLGLPTVRKIVEAHGGSISCESEPGRGTRFLISLPPA
ncbi:MAG: ATP-binding protein [Planctomycetota bacterium]|nr:ATP-binding protein [Planctomycetota bacterium]MDA1249396.1 ATP-binding protein [Planctomycetota bacterium]